MLRKMINWFYKKTDSNLAANLTTVLNVINKRLLDDLFEEYKSEIDRVSAKDYAIMVRDFILNNEPIAKLGIESPAVYSILMSKVEKKLKVDPELVDIAIYSTLVKEWVQFLSTQKPVSQQEVDKNREHIGALILLSGSNKKFNFQSVEDMAGFLVLHYPDLVKKYVSRKYQ